MTWRILTSDKLDNINNSFNSWLMII